MLKNVTIVLLIMLIVTLLVIIRNQNSTIEYQEEFINDYKNYILDIPATDNATQEVINDLRDSLRDCQNQRK